MIDPISAAGHFFMTKPDSIRWEYSVPEEMRFIVFGDEYTGFFPEQKRAEKKFKAQRKSLEKRTEKQVSRLRNEFNKNPYVKRAQSAVDDVSKQIEKNVDSLFETLNVASQRDLHRVNRKLSTINKKLRELEKSNTAS